MKKIVFSLIALIILCVGGFFVTSPYKFMSIFSSYKTQTILYRNKVDSDITIQHQMKDLGGRGYSKRTVIVKPKFFWENTTPVDVKQIDSDQWYKVDEFVNEQGLHSP